MAATTVKEIPTPSGVPEFHGDLRAWTREVKVYLDRELNAIHREIERLHTVKEDVIVP